MGQKQKTERKGRKKERRAKVGNNNGQLRIATPPRVAHAKPHGTIVKRSTFVNLKLLGLLMNSLI